MRKYVSLLILGSTLIMAACTSQEEETKKVIRPVKIETVSTQLNVSQKSYPAVVLPAQQAELSFRASGQIIEMLVKASTEVKEDQILAKLDTSDFEAQVTGLESQLEQAQAQLDTLTSGARDEDVASLRANITAAKAQVNVVRLALGRTQQLFDKGIIAKAKLDADRAELEVANAKLEAARQELVKGETGGRREEIAAQIAVIKGIEANLGVARDSLSYATMRAPFDGIIARRDVDNFANIQAKQTIIVIQKLDRLELSFDIPGPDVAKLNREKPPVITVNLDAIGDVSLKADLVEFNTTANTATQTFTGRVVIDQPDRPIILPGMNGLVTLTDDKDEKPKRIMIPGTALSSDPSGNAYIWVLDGKIVSRRKVTSGSATGSMIEVVDGLKEGEKIVTAGVSFLQEGMEVRIIADKD